MSEEEVYVSITQCIIIKFLVCNGVKLAEIFYRLYLQFCSDTLLKAQVYKWDKFFHKGQKDISNLIHSCSPRSSITPQNLFQV